MQSLYTCLFCCFKLKKNKHMRYKENKFFLLLVLGTVFIISLIYILLHLQGDTNSFNAFVRHLDSSHKYWLNGFLGSIFNFKNVGILNWLILPLSIVFFVQKSIVNKGEKALIFCLDLRPINYFFSWKL